MGAPRRKRSRSRGRPVRRKPKARMGAKTMARIARRGARAVFNSQVETKKSSHALASDTMFHNSINIIDSDCFKTTNGVTDPENLDTLNRVGDEITVTKIVFRGILEMPPNQTEVYIRIMFVKCAKGDTPTTATLFSQLSVCKLIDPVDRERFKIIFTKTFKLKSGNLGVGNSQSAYGLMTQGGAAQAPTTGVGYSNYNDVKSLGSATRVFSHTISGKKLFRNGTLKYQNGTYQPKFYDYHLLGFAYVNADTDTANSGAGTGTMAAAYLKHYYSQLHFKDA